VRCRTQFDSSKHDSKDKVWNDDENIWDARNQMEWYIKRGDNVAVNEPVTHSFYRLFREANYTGKFSEELFQCEDEVAPKRFEPHMTTLCRMDCATDIQYSQMEDFTSAATGESMKKLSYQLEVKPSGASAEFALLINGRRQAGKNFNISFK